jgi:hypothetical protein
MATLPPLLNLAPWRLVPELADQHLFAALYEILFVSLMAESQENGETHHKNTARFRRNGAAR